MATANLRFYAELNDFLPADRRQRDWLLAFQPPAPARHLIETCGVPHTEVELILRGSESIGLDAPVGEGDRLAVYPMFESFDVRPLLRLRRLPLRRPSFVADAHLGALARLAASEQRILLTRDRQLLMRQAVTHGCYLRSGATEALLAELIQRLQLCADIAPFTRCTLCNGPLEVASPQAVRSQVPPRVRERNRDFWRCQGCGRIYWKGTHWEAMRRQIDSICPPSPEQGASSSKGRSVPWE